MKYYCIIEDALVTDIMLGESGFNKSTVTQILMDDGTATGFSIVSALSNTVPSLVGFKKYTAEEVIVQRDLIMDGRHVINRVEPSTKLSKFIASDGTHAKYQSIGIATTAAPTVTWISDDDYYLSGVMVHFSNSDNGDNVDFELLDSDDTLLGVFADGWLIWDGPYSEDLPRTKVLTGQKIKITLNKVGASATTALFNGRFHKI